MWNAILQTKEATQNRARDDDLLWAAHQPKVITTICHTLEEWLGTMLPRATSNHQEAIIVCVAEWETIIGAVYVHEVAPSGSTSYLRNESTAAARELVASLVKPSPFVFRAVRPTELPKIARG